MTQKTPNPIPKIRLHLVFAASLFTLAACGGGGGGGGNDPQANAGDVSVAVRSKPLLAGDADCPNGGILVESGIDENGNSLLDDNEVDKAEKVCNGQDGADGADGSNGLDALVSTSTINTGDATCPNGGILIETGIDSNRNGSLDNGEVNKSEKLCNGQDGANGQNGSDGQDGSNGLNSLIAFSDEPAGSNCPYGGMRVDSGLDNNGNGTLDIGEIDQTGFVCSQLDSSIGWGVATQLGSDGYGSTHSTPSIAMNDDGNAIAFWGRILDTSAWASNYTPGEGWSKNQVVDFFSRPIHDPQIAMDNNGNAIAVWDGSFDDPSGNRTGYIGIAFYNTETGWDYYSYSLRTIQYDPDGRKFPQIAKDDNGNTMVVWQESDGTHTNIWSTFNRIDNDIWSTPVLVETDDAGDASKPQIVAGLGDWWWAVWEQSNGTHTRIWVNRYRDDDTGWRTPMQVDSNNNGDSYDPQIAIDKNGNVFVVWSQSDGYIWARRYDWIQGLLNGNGWEAPVQIETSIPYASSGNTAYQPQIATDDAGNAIAVWKIYYGGIRANRYIDGSGWGAPELIDSDGEGFGNSPQIAMDGSGNALVVWRSQTPKFDFGASGNGDWTYSYDIWSNRYTVGLGWDRAEKIGTAISSTPSPATDDAWSPKLAMDGAGNAFAIWDHYDENGNAYSVQINRWLTP